MLPEESEDPSSAADAAGAAVPEESSAVLSLPSTKQHSAVSRGIRIPGTAETPNGMQMERAERWLVGSGGTDPLCD